MSAGKNYAAQAAMKCQDPIFVAFLLDVSGVSIDQRDYEKVALYELCKISSKKQLNTEPEAAKNWFRVLDWFNRWVAGEGKSHNGGLNPPFRMGEVAFGRGSKLSQNPFDKNYAPHKYDKPCDLWKRGWHTAMWREGPNKKEV